MLIIVDDFADDPSFSRNSKLLHSLFTRGRHSMISTIVATQKFSAIHPIIRTNATELYVYRLRNYRDLESFIEELSALYDKKTLLKLYERATDAPYSFLYVKLTAKTKDNMFFWAAVFQAVAAAWHAAEAAADLMPLKVFLVPHTHADTGWELTIDQCVSHRTP